MSNFVTCIECGHHPVSDQAERCPKCARQEFKGVYCMICGKLSKASSLECILPPPYDPEAYENPPQIKKYYHPLCVDLRDSTTKVPFKQEKGFCPACKFVYITKETGFSSTYGYYYPFSCSNCGHKITIPPDKTKLSNCFFCNLSVATELGVKLFYKDKDYFAHPICYSSNERKTFIKNQNNNYNFYKFEKADREAKEKEKALKEKIAKERKETYGSIIGLFLMFCVFLIVIGFLFRLPDIFLFGIYGFFIGFIIALINDKIDFS
ncbi:MAG: hypothetical protein RMY30_038280 [Nostoc sp. CmiSLP01]|nr:hypothetical protein [Nostoc sp. CmiSLP01]MDZ8286015.1 hypothetical protein [Nostoc sp. ChiSLP01]